MDVSGARRSGVSGVGGSAPDHPGGRPAATSALEVITTADDAAWAAVLADVAQHDFHHLAGYHRLAESRGEGTAILFAMRSRTHLIAVPLLLRPIDPAHPAGPWDATSVYGYAGPVASSAPIPARVIDAFGQALRLELGRRRVVAVFSRLHPLLEQQRLVEGLGETRAGGPTVSIDLTLSLDAQWSGFNKGTRRLIRRAAEAGVTCVHDHELRNLDAWTELYQETMERVGASSSHRHDRAYFERMAAELGPVLHLFVAHVDGEVAAAGLFTICDGIVQAHLGASRARFAALSPGRVVDDTARRWATAAGARVLHLGGGVGGREDSLFQYKAGFSDRRHEFSTWRWIVDAEAYAELCRRQAGSAVPTTVDSGEFFPAYRWPIDQTPAAGPAGEP